MATTLRDPRYRAIVARLIAARKADGLNQRDVAERLGKTQSYVAKVELHERRLDVVQLVEWVRALDLDERKFLVEIVKDIPAVKKRR